MLPNLRLSGAGTSPIDSLGDFLGISAAAAAVRGLDNTNKSSIISTNRGPNNSSSAHESLVSSMISSSSSSIVGHQNEGHQSSAQSWGNASKTLADYVKESAWQNSITTNTNTSNSMPWAAAVKMPPDHHNTQANNSQQQQFDYNSTIGSWSSPDTSSSNRGGWNADGLSKSDGALDDGTAIWGNPISKKTGVDWAEKESINNPPPAQSSSNIEKRIQKPEPTISSLNGTEAWGAPVRSSVSNSQQQQQQQQQQQNLHKQSKNDISGNTYGTKSANESLSWGESSSLHASSNENSSPPKNSVWNNLGISKQKSSDWLSASSSIGNNNTNANSRIDELNKQLESTNLFDSVSSMTKNASSNNPNLDLHSMGGLVLSNSIGSASNSGNNNGSGLSGGNGINDLKQMSANYSNDLLDSPIRQTSGTSSSINQQSQQMDSAAYSSASTPSRDLLKQMVHQIQLAVQAGHLNAHILNQPMSTPTLQLVYQLLQQIKTLHQLQEIQQRANIKSDMNSPSNMDLQINRIRQNISLLQKAITQQQATLTKNETLADANIKQQQQQQQHHHQQQQQQQQANNYSYATISKLSSNLKVPSNNMSNMINNSNIDSFRRSSLIDTFSNSNSDSLRSAQATFDANATIDKTLSSLILASSSANNILGSNKTITTSGDFSKAQGFNTGNISQQPTKSLLSAQSSSSSSSAWSAFSSNDLVSQQAWPSQLRISSNVSPDHQHQYSAFDNMAPEFGPGKAWRGSSILSYGKDNSTMASGGNIQRSSSALYDWGDLTSSTLQFNAENNHHVGKQQQASSSSASGGGRPAPPPGLLSNFGPIIGSSPSANGISLLDSKIRGGSSEEGQLPSRESSSSLWSGNWFD